MVEWFTKQPGSIPTAECEDGSAMMILGAEADYVRLPSELGGEVRRVRRVFDAPCPVRKTVCKHYELEGGIYVAESDQFYWYRLRS